MSWRRSTGAVTVEGSVGGCAIIMRMELCKGNYTLIFLVAAPCDLRGLGLLTRFLLRTLSRSQGSLTFIVGFLRRCIR
jgi:hypothetical protein